MRFLTPTAPSPARTLTVATALMFMSSTSALALEGKALLDALIAESKTKISYGSAEEDGARLILTKVDIDPVEGQDLSIARIVLTGFREEGGDVVLDAVQMSDLAGGESGNTQSATLATIDGKAISVPRVLFAGEKVEPYGLRIKIGSWDAADLKTTNKDGSVVTIRTMDVDAADVPLDFRYEPDAVEKAGDRPAEAPLKLARLAVEGVGVESKGVFSRVDSVALENLTLPTTQDAPVDQWLNDGLTLAVGSVDVTRGATKLGGMGGLTASIDPPASDGTIRQTGQMKGLFVTADAFPDQAARDNLKALGYEEIRVNSNGTGSYNLKTGRVESNPTAIDAENMFDLTLDYVLTGYTREVANEIQQASTPETPGGQPDLAALLPALGKIAVESVNLTLTDDGLTGKLLDYQGQQMGTTGDQLAQGAPMMVGLGLGGLNMPEFAQSVAAAVGTFLQTKGSLTVSSKPDAPVTLDRVFAAAQGGAKPVIELFELQVTAAGR